jgi:hypothetical protein
MGPILKIGKNQKAPPFSAHQIDQALMPHSWFCKNGMILRRARRAYWHLKKRLAARLAVGNVVTAVRYWVNSGRHLLNLLFGVGSECRSAL